MTTVPVPLSRRLRRALWAFVALAALLAAVSGPASDVETPFQPRTAVSVGTELECPQADLTQPGVLFPDWLAGPAPPAMLTRRALPSLAEGPPPAPPLRPPRA